MRNRIFILSLLGGCSLGALGIPAHAQELQGEEEFKLNTVTVTARRTEENLQDVPVAVTAFDENAMTAKAIESAQDLQFSVPSLTVTGYYGGLSGRYSLRGLTDGVASYFAEVPGGPTSAAAPYFDIQSVQVLNGPQGTLFGRANTAGAVLITPQRPDMSHYSGMFKIEVGDYSEQNFLGVANLPLIKDELAVRIAVNRRRNDGYVNVINSTERLQQTSDDSLRIGIEWNPGGGRFTNYSLFNFYNVDQAPTPGILSGYNPAAALFNLPASVDAPNGALIGGAVFGSICNTAVATGLASSVNDCIDQRLQIASTFGPALAAEVARANSGDRGVRSFPGGGVTQLRDQLEQQFITNQMQYDFGELGFTDLTANYIFGFQRNKALSGFSQTGIGLISENYFSGTPVFSSSGLGAGASSSNSAPDGSVVARIGPWVETTTHELRFSGTTSNDLLTWTAGGFYQDSPVAKDTSGTANYYRIFSGILTPNLGWQAANDFPIGGESTQKALFANGTLNLSEFAPAVHSLNLTGGFRRSWDESKLVTARAVASYPSGTITPGAESTAQTKSEGDNSTLSVDVGVTDDLLIYIARRTGYRPGGSNNVTGAEDLPFFSSTFGPETVEDIEVGAKFDFSLGGTQGRLNAAAYKADYTDIQRSMRAFIGSTQTIYTANVAAAEIKGLELQGALIWNNWQIDGSYSYTDATFTDWISSDPLNVLRPNDPACLSSSPASVCLIDLSNEPFPNTPEHQLSATISYRLPLPTDIGSVKATLNGSYRSKMNFDVGSVARVEALFPGQEDAYTQDAFSRFDARIDWERMFGSNFDAALFVRNLTDETYATFGSFQYTSLGTAIKGYGAPRTIGASLTYRFGE